MDIGWEVEVTLEDGIIRWNRIIVVWSSEGIHFFQMCSTIGHCMDQYFVSFWNNYGPIYELGVRTLTM